MTPGRRAVLAAIAVLVAACIPGALTVGATDGGPGGSDGAASMDSAQGEAGADQASNLDGPTDQVAAGDGQDAVAQTDASDAAALPDGYIQCAATTVQCNAAGGDECCLNVFGMMAADGGSVYELTMASCEAVGGPNCGSYLGTGNNFNENFPQTCSTKADCTNGAACCVPFSDAGDLRLGMGIACQATCSAPDKAICRTTNDCVVGTCQPETDPILSHLYAGYCQ